MRQIHCVGYRCRPGIRDTHRSRIDTRHCPVIDSVLGQVCRRIERSSVQVVGAPQCNVTLVVPITVSVVDIDMFPDVAVIVVVPAATETASPMLLIVETSLFDDLQPTNDVISDVVPSECLPVAVGCWVKSRQITYIYFIPF